MRPFFLIILWLLLPGYGYGIDVDVKVKGLNRRLETNVRNFLSIEQEKRREGLTASRVRFLHTRAESEIRDALRPFGYFRPQTDARLKQNEQQFEAIYKIEPGPLMYLTRVEFKILGEGRDDPSINRNFPLAEGDVLDQVRYENAKQSMLSAVVELGYLNARFIVHQLLVDMDNDEAAIILHLDTAKRFRFGEVRFTQDFMNPEFLARYLDFEPGDLFNHRKLLNLQSHLIDTDYFSQVDVLTLREEADGDQVPVEIILSPGKSTRYRIGLGYSTDEGPRISLDWHRRRIGQNGHNMLTEIRLSEANSLIRSEYVIPSERPSKDFLSAAVKLENFDTDSRTSDIALVDLSKTKALENDWRRRLSLDYSYERFLVGDQKDIATLFAPSVLWSRIMADERRIMQRGHRMEFRIEGTIDEILSTTSYLQVFNSSSLIHGFDEGNWRLHASTRLGATLTDDLLDLPASKRFFAGGDSTVRGYTLDELGPMDEDGTVVGGRYLAVATVELERRVIGNWSTALFYDVGNAFDPDYPSQAESSAGIGVRWHSPVGPVRFDLAYRLDPDDHGVRLHVAIGPEL